MKDDHSVFIRYRNGSLLSIKPDIKSKVAEIVPLLEQDNNYEKVLNGVIKGIADGSGWGVAPESTWGNTVKELFSINKRYSGNNPSDETVKALIGLLKILIEGDENTRIDWDKIRDYIIENIDSLSPMSDARLFIHEGQEIRRDANGEYYYEDPKLGKVLVRGLKTPPEEKLQFYTNDTQIGYGRLYKILRFVALFDIAYEYTHSRKDFPDKLSCTLFDNEGSTNYLDWVWQMPSPFDFVPMQWYPRSPYSNPDWLGCDLVMHLPFPNANSGETIVPFPPTDEAYKKWEETFRGFKWQIEIPITSNLLIGENSEEYFDFFDRKVRWINGNAFVLPMLIVPANDDDGTDGIEIARKFLSILNIGHEVTLSERLMSQQSLRYIPLYRQPRMTIFELVDPKYLMPQDDYTKYSKEKWYALAFLREAVSSNSIYYSFLNYYKIVELANEGKMKRTTKWIDANVKRVCDSKNIDWYNKMVVNRKIKHPGFYLFKTQRTAIAHAEYTLETSITHNPDDPTDWNRTRDDLVVMKALAKDVLDSL